MYGPVFVAIATIGTAITGASATATRVFFQLVEAVALAGAGVIIWRRTTSWAAVAFLVLNPALVLVVNGAHIDIVVGLALLAGTLLLVDGHAGRQGPCSRSARW